MACAAAVLAEPWSLWRQRFGETRWQRHARCRDFEAMEAAVLLAESMNAGGRLLATRTERNPNRSPPDDDPAREVEFVFTVELWHRAPGSGEWMACGVFRSAAHAWASLTGSPADLRPGRYRAVPLGTHPDDVQEAND